MLLPKNSIFGWPKAHLDIDSFSPAFCICWKTASMLIISSSTLLAAIPMSSTYWAHLSSFTSASRDSRIVLLNADKDLFNPCASRGVTLILKSVLMPMSRRCLANIVWYLTSSSSILCCSCSVRIESSQLNSLRNAWRFSSSHVGLSFSASEFDEFVVDASFYLF